MAAILSFLGTAFAKIFADKVIGWLAFKAVLVFLFITVIPLILNNFLYEIIQIIMSFASDQSSGAAALNGTMTVNRH